MNVFKHRIIQNDPESEECFELADSWIRECLQNHGSHCQINCGKKAPKRLVDLGAWTSSTYPRLIETASEAALEPSGVRYAALSYCWGNSCTFKATSANINALKASIPFTELPKTIRHAIIVAYRLGIRYLWVDALCIIQGTDRIALTDWRSESSRSQHIYQGAFITIAATSAASSEDGLFQGLPAMRTASPPLKSGAKNDNLLYIGPDPPPYLAHMEPLNSRGWALQEKILSNRILSYGKAGLSWQCRKSQHLETVRDSDLTQSERLTYLNEEDIIHKDWRTIIEDYSGRNLTNGHDRLVALYGLSAAISNKNKDKYLAGVWKSDLAVQLLWRHSKKGSKPRSHYKRQPQYLAPSWSWASVEGKIEFIRGYGTLSATLWCSLNVRRSQHLYEMRMRPLHVFGTIRVVDSIRFDHFGRYYGMAERQVDWISYPLTLRTYLDDLDDLPKSSILDRPDRPKQLRNLVFLDLGCKMEKHGVCTAGLILLRHKYATSMFRRVGLFEGLDENEICDGKTKKIFQKGKATKWIKII